MPEPMTLALVGAGGGSMLWELARRQFRVFKDIFDVIGGSVLFVLFLPVMLVCAAMIKICDPAGPVLFTQVRVGQNGRLITVYKLRSMYVDAEKNGQAVWAGKQDDRVIPICRWMRRSHVDELPQLVNIAKGEMSLVGPRPERPEMFEKLCRDMPNFEDRLAVKPGLTGLAQIKNGYDTDIESVRRKLDMDLQYIETMSLVGDLKLLFATFAKFNDKAAH